MGDIINNLPKLHSLDISGTPTGSNLKFNKLITCSGESGRLRIDLPDLSNLDRLSGSDSKPGHNTIIAYGLLMLD